MQIVIKIVVLLAFIVQFVPLHARVQADSIGDFEAAVLVAESHYSGFFAKVNTDTRKSYDSFCDSLRLNIKSRCQNELDATCQYVGWFRDNHFRVKADGFQKYQKPIIDYKAIIGEYAPRLLCQKIDNLTFLMRIPSFERNKTMDKWLKQAIKAYEKSGCVNLIIDIRGNGGGFFNYTDELMELMADKDYTWDATEFRNSQSNMKYVKANYSDRWTTIRKNIGVNDAFCPLTGEYKHNASAYKHKPRKVGVIIDNWTASASENLLIAIKAGSMRTTIYGKDNSMGCCDFADVRGFMLPSGKIIYCPICRSVTNPNGRYDAEGISPDIRIMLPYPNRLTDNIDEWTMWVANHLKQVSER